MDFYMSSVIIVELLMLAMIIHAMKYSCFTKTQKIWYLLTFTSVMICTAAEYAVHCGYYKESLAIPLTFLTVIQFSISPLLAVFFSGALGLHKESKIAILFFLSNLLIEMFLAPFGSIFYFDSVGYHRGELFIIYEMFYLVGLAYLIVCMFIAGRRFQHRDSITIIMVLVIIVSGIIPMTFLNIHTAYISIGISACLCYIYYNDLVQEDIKIELVNNEKKISNMQEHIISGLANLIESRDTDTGEHITRTSKYVKAISERAMQKGIYKDEINAHFISLMYTLASMHDVGKILVPDRILKKPGKLTPEEYEAMKVHAASGGDVVMKILSGVADEEYLRFVSDIATYHHEWWDGSGYPKKLKGEEIPLCARIMAIADVFDALISKRCYKDAIPVDEAIKIIKEESGTHFDPLLVDVFVEYIESEEK